MHKRLVCIIVKRPILINLRNFLASIEMLLYEPIFFKIIGEHKWCALTWTALYWVFLFRFQF